MYVYMYYVRSPINRYVWEHNTPITSVEVSQHAAHHWASHHSATLETQDPRPHTFFRWRDGNRGHHQTMLPYIYICICHRVTHTYIYIIIYILYTDILIYTCGMMRWLNIKKWWALYIDILPWLIVGEKRDLAGFNHQTLGVCQFWMNSWFSISLLAIWGYGIDSMLQ